jgi:Mg2+/Co2+ transporter CorB
VNPNDYLSLFIPLMVAVVIVAWIIVRHLTASKQARAELTSSEEYRGLADEYRRLSDMAITAQEHTDLRLTDIGVRIDELRDQLEQMHRILKEVE